MPPNCFQSLNLEPWKTSILEDSVHEAITEPADTTLNAPSTSHRDMKNLHWPTLPSHGHIDMFKQPSSPPSVGCVTPCIFPSTTPLPTAEKTRQAARYPFIHVWGGKLKNMPGTPEFFEKERREGRGKPEEYQYYGPPKDLLDDLRQL